MPHAIKIKRHGLGIPHNRKVPFRLWLNEQPRKDLTYREVLRPDEKGWTAEDFALEALKRGVDVRFQTVCKWASGSQPRQVRYQIERVFDGIRF